MEEQLKRAIDVIGGPARVAELLRISAQAVSKWDKAPPNRVLDLERATRERGEEVSRYELRPDVFGSAASH